MAEDNDNSFSLGSITSRINVVASVGKKMFDAIGGTQTLKDLIEVNSEMDSLRQRLVSVEGSAGAAVDRFGYLRSFSDEIGVDLKGAAEGYLSITQAAQGTALEGAGAKDIFEGIASAGVAIGLSANDTNKALGSLGDMIQNGTVSADALRKNLGQIPGVFDIAARSMNMSTQDLEQFMAAGKIAADDFLPAFAARLKTEFAGGLAEASDSFEANRNRFNNSMAGMKDDLGGVLEDAAMVAMPLVKDLVGVLEEVVSFIKDSSPRIQEFIGGVIEDMRSVWTSLAPVLEALEPLFTTIIEVLFDVGGQVRQFLVGALQDMGPAMKNIATMLSNIFVPVLKVVSIVVKALIENLGYLVGSFAELATPVSEFFAWLSEGVTYLFSGIVEEVKSKQDQFNETLKGAFDGDNLNQFFADLANKHGNTYVENLLQQWKKAARFLDMVYPSWKGSAMKQYEYIVEKINGPQPAGKGTGDDKGTGTGKGGKTTHGTIIPARNADTKVDRVQGNNPVNINISIHDGLVKTINLTTNNFKEGIGRMKEEVAEALTGAIRDSQIIAGR